MSAKHLNESNRLHTGPGGIGIYNCSAGAGTGAESG